MSSTGESPEPNAGPSLLTKMVKFFLAACLAGGLGGGLIGAAFVIIGSMIDPNSFQFGGSTDPAGVAVLFFLSWGFAGLLLGLVVGIGGAIVIAIRR